MAQSGYTPIKIYSSTTAGAVPLAANLAQGELAINTYDGKLYYKNSSSVVTLLASTAGASGDVVGPASATDNALARFDTTTGKLIQNSIAILTDAGALSGLTGLSTTSITDSGLTSGRVTYATTGGLLTDSANMTFNGTTLTTLNLAYTGTLTGGTGVVNLGSQFYKDASGNIGLGTAPSAWISSWSAIQGTAKASTVLAGSSASYMTANMYLNTSSQYVYLNSAAATMYQQTGGAHYWYYAPSGTAGNTFSLSTGMVIDSSGNVGIGTSIPAFPLDVGGATANIRVAPTTATNNALTRYVNTGGTGFVGLDNSVGGLTSAYALNLYHTGAYPIVMSTSGTEAMRIDSSGNVGIGTSSSSRKFEVHGAPVSIGGAATGMLVSVVNNTTTFNSSPTSGMSFFNRFNTAGGTFPSAALQGGKENTTDGNYAGFMSFFTTNSVGNANESMRIDSSGNVGIGTSSPASKLEVIGSAYIGNSTTNGSVRLRLDGTGTTGNVPSIQFRSGGVTKAYFGLSGAYAGDTSTDALIATDFVGGAIRFYGGNAGTEAMRIDSSGNLLVGTTTTSIAGTTLSGKGIGQSADYSGTYAQAINSSSTTGNQLFVAFGRGGSSCGYIISTGTNSTSYGTSSDYRLKDNVVPMTGALAKVQALKPVTYTWKSDGSDGQGFIAHELQAIVPECVIGKKDAVDAKGKPVYQGIDTSFLVATLTKAIQEQQVMIEELKAKVTALENK